MGMLPQPYSDNLDRLDLDVAGQLDVLFQQVIIRTVEPATAGILWNDNGIISVSGGGPGNSFLRPNGVDSYFRPDGTSTYLRP